MKEVEKDRKEEEDVKIVSGVSVSVTPSWTPEPLESSSHHTLLGELVQY